MRERAVPVALLAMLLGLVGLLAFRPRTPHQAPLVVIQEEGKADSGAATADGGLPLATVDASVVLRPPVALGSEGGAEGGAAVQARLLDRPLRVATLGWALAAPGVMLGPAQDHEGADGGRPPFELELAPVDTLAQIEGRLVRGGADQEGADVVVLPLPELVASYERLRALEPQAFLLVGFSTSSEFLYPRAGASPGRVLPGDVKVSVSSRDRPESLQWMALFTLDAFGVSPGRVKFQAAEGDASPFFAGRFTDKNDGKHLLSTYEADRLIPLVAAAPKGALDSRGPLYRAWASSWLDGLDRAYKDASTAGMRLSTRTGATFSASVQGKTEPGAALDAFGRMGRVDLAENLRWLAPGPERPAPLEALFLRNLEAFRQAGLVVAPAPPSAVQGAAVAEIGRGVKPAVEKVATPRGDPPLLVRREPGPIDDAELQRLVLVYSAVFDRAPLRVSLKGGDKASTAFVEATRSKLGLPPEKLLVGKTPMAGASAILEVLRREP